MDIQAAIDELNRKGYSLNLYQYSLKHETTHNLGRPLWDATAYERKTGRMAMFGAGTTWDAALAQLIDKVRGDWSPAPAAAKDPFDFDEEDPLA